MEASQQKHLEELASILVTPQRFGSVALEQTVASVFKMYPDLPQAQLTYFPEQSGELE